MEIKSIVLNQSQLAVYNELIKNIQTLESQMLTVLDASNPQMVAEQLAGAVPLCGMTGRIMEAAKTIHDYAIGQAVSELMGNEYLKDAKQQIISAYLKGKCAKYAGVYERAHRACTDLSTYIMGCQSILKIATEEMKMSRFGANIQT